MATATLVSADGVITTNVGRLYATMERLLGRPLSPAERASLQSSFLGISTGTVNPGDLITADLFNAMRSDINNLAERLAAVEGTSGGPTITDILPKDGVEVNKPMRIEGRNFDREPRRNRVFVGGTEILGVQQQSTTTALFVSVPDIFAGLPQRFDVVVELPDGRRSNAFPTVVRPAQIVQGGTFPIGSAAVPIGNILVGQTLMMTWPVTARTLVDDTLDVEALVTRANGANVAAWLATASFPTGNPMPIGVGLTVRISLRVTVPAGATDAELQIRVTSRLDPGISSVSSAVPVRVNAPIEASDPRVTIKLDRNPLGDAVRNGKVTIDGVEDDGLLVKEGQAGEFTVTAQNARVDGANADFEYEVSVDPAGDWILDQPIPPNSLGVAPGIGAKVTMMLTNNGGGVGDTARLRFKVSQTKTMGGLAAYSAFHVIPMKIV